MPFKFPEISNVSLLGFIGLSLSFCPFTLSATLSSVTLAVSQPLVTYGHPLTLTAAVSPPSTTGTVSFYDGVFLLGTIPLSGAASSLSDLLLAAGPHNLRARYSGDPANIASTSSVVPVQVVASPSSGFTDAPGSPVLSTPQYQSSPVHAAAAADFNGDGNLDLAILRAPTYQNGVVVTGSSVQMLFGDGTGAFRLGNPIPTGFTGQIGSPGSTGPVVGDINNDGKIDLVFPAEIADSVQSLWSVNVWLGDGNGGFTPAPGSPFAQSGDNTIGPVALADLDGDGNLDLTFVNLSGLSVWLGDGTGSFPQHLGPFPLPLFPNFLPAQLDVLDFNGDGHVDLLITDPSRFQLLLGDGTGNVVIAPPPPTFIYSGIPVIGDFNNDGKSDIALTNYDNAAVNLVVGNAQSTITEQVIRLPDSSYADRLAVGDFNGDGKLDLLLLGTNSNNSTLNILEGDGTGGFISPPVRAAQLTRFGGELSIFELNGDGKSDIVLVGSLTNQNPATPVVEVLLGSNITAPASISIYAGNGQSVSDVSPFSPPLQAIVKDSNGQPVSNVAVLFSGTSVLYPLVEVTDRNGIASVDELLFSNTGTQTVAATVQGLSGGADFTIHVLPENLAASVTGISNGFLYSRVSRTYLGQLQITAAYYPLGFWSPLKVVFTGLPAGLTLANAAGTYNGAPYFVLSQPQFSYTVPLAFSGPPGLTVQFTPTFLMGDLP